MNHQNNPHNPRWAFFGTSPIATYVLDTLELRGYIPECVVTPHGKPQGRHKEIIPSAVEQWAYTRNISVQHDHQIGTDWDVCIVADYGRILPRTVLGMARRGFLNVHPSLLPRLRGPSPIQTAILTDERITGVTVMLLDEIMDHGPIVAQKQVPMYPWPPHRGTMEQTLMREGGHLLADILPSWIAATIEAHPQQHDHATFSSKITKDDGLLDLSADPYHNLLKIHALEGWPGTYAFFERNNVPIRVAILDATVENNSLVITRVKPEGRRDMTYIDFMNSGARIVR